MGYYVPFVNRSVELERLREYSSKGFYPVLFIYGPEGCGKTRLLKEFLDSVEGLEGYITVYVDAQEMRSIEQAIYGPREIVRFASKLISAISEGVGKVIAELLPYLIRKVFAKHVRGRHVVIAVDDAIRPLGLQVIEAYAKKLYDLLEWLLGQGAEAVFIVATSSEGSSMRLLARHNYVTLDFIWNLDRKSTYRLLELLQAPKEVFNEVYRWTGGNPRAILELKSLSWNVNLWLRRIVKKLKPLVYELAYKHGRILKEACEKS